MPAGTHNLIGAQKIEAGSTYDKTVPLVDASGVALNFDSSAGGFDVVGVRLYFRLSVDEPGAPLLVLGKITEAAAILGTTGVYIDESVVSVGVRIVLDAIDASALSYDFGTDLPLLDERTGVYDLEVFDAGGTIRVWRLLEGSYEVSPETSRPAIS